jgi:hypothetical protein
VPGDSDAVADPDGADFGAVVAGAVDFARVGEGEGAGPFASAAAMADFSVARSV